MPLSKAFETAVELSKTAADLAKPVVQKAVDGGKNKEE
jgi:hypothetical protein